MEGADRFRDRNKVPLGLPAASADTDAEDRSVYGYIEGDGSEDFEDEDVGDTEHSQPTDHPNYPRISYARDGPNTQLAKDVLAQLLQLNPSSFGCNETFDLSAIEQRLPRPRFSEQEVHTRADYRVNRIPILVAETLEGIKSSFLENPLWVRQVRFWGEYKRVQQPTTDPPFFELRCSFAAAKSECGKLAELCSNSLVLLHLPANQLGDGHPRRASFKIGSGDLRNMVILGHIKSFSVDQEQVPRGKNEPFWPTAKGTLPKPGTPIARIVLTIRFVLEGRNKENYSREALSRFVALCQEVQPKTNTEPSWRKSINLEMTFIGKLHQFFRMVRMLSLPDRPDDLVDDYNVTTTPIGDQQQQLPFRHHKPTTPRCPLLNADNTRCRATFQDGQEFREHLIRAHDNRTMSVSSDCFQNFLLCYCTAYCLADRDSDRNVFGPYCPLCQNGGKAVSAPTQTLSCEQINDHISQHFSLPLLYCAGCRDILPSDTVAQPHQQAGHLVNTPEQYFRASRGGLPPLAAWKRLDELIRQAYTVQVEKPAPRVTIHQGRLQLNRRRTVKQDEDSDPDAANYSQILNDALTNYAQDWERLSDLGDDMLKVFCSFGRSETLARLIVISGPSQRMECLRMLEPHFRQLLTHRYASRAFAVLIAFSPDTSWNTYIQAVHSRVLDLRNNVTAGYAIRVLLTDRMLSDDRHATLSAVLLGLPTATTEPNYELQFDDEHWNARGIIWSGVAARDYPATRYLARALAPNFLVHALDSVANTAMRDLVRLVGRESELVVLHEEYREFLNIGLNTLNEYYADVHGNYLAQVIISSAPAEEVRQSSFFRAILNPDNLDQFMAAVDQEVTSPVIQCLIQVADNMTVHRMARALCFKDVRLTPAESYPHLLRLLRARFGEIVLRRIIFSVISRSSITVMRDSVFELSRRRDSRNVNTPLDRAIVSIAGACTYRLRQIRNNARAQGAVGPPRGPQNRTGPRRGQGRRGAFT